MKQKLIAVAVAGVFAAPAVALAQASTVQIYGTINAEYGFASGAPLAAGAGNSASWDGLNSGSSNLGFKGEEKLSGGMSAWFQCETDLGFLKGDTVGAGDAATQGGWCSRNSAIGLKGGFGNFYVGTWDSPTKRAVGQHRILGETGWHGVQGMLLSNGGGFTGTYSARNANSINYESPNFSGFTLLAQTTSTKAASGATTGAGLEGRSSSFGLNYGAGPLAASLAYTTQDDNRSGGGAATAGVNGRKDTAMVLGASYTIGAAKIGLLYIDATSQPNATTELKRKSWNIAGTYALGGPHSLIAGYTVAGDTKTNQAGVVADRGDNTGADQYTIGYQNALSKRTTAGVTYMYNKNDSRATGYSVGNNHLTGMVAGESTSVIAMQVTHKF